MKRKFVSVLSSICSVFLCFALVGCDLGGNSGDGTGSGSGNGEVESPAHEHTFASEWSKNETHHWYAATCGHSDEVKGKAEHAYNGEHVCTACGYGYEHTFASEWSKDGKYHWYAATCGHSDEVKGKAEHAYNSEYVCTACGYAHEHTFASEWSKNETHHWYAATCGHSDEKKSQTVHAFVGATCSVCGFSLSPTEGLSYTLSGDETYYTVSGIGAATDSVIIIPSTYEDKPVKGIDTLAFEGCSTITEVIIPDSVETIGNRAFKGCVGLTDVIVPDSVTSIGSGAFSGCSMLTSMTIPFVGGSATATVAGENTLFGYIFGTASYVGGECIRQLYAGSQYKEYYIPSALRSVTITGGKIFYGGFYNCDMLTDVVIGDGVESIGSSAFAFCYNLENVTLGRGATVIGGYAFQDAGLTSVVIPDNFETIGSHAFHRCNTLMKVTLGTGLTTVNDNAFLGCYKLIEVENLSDSLTIEKGVTANGYVGKYAKNIYTASSGESKLTVVQDEYVCYTDDEAEEYYLVGYLGKQASITLPESLGGNDYVVYDYAFCDRDDLSHVVFGDGVTAIGEKAFYDCENLLSVTLGRNLDDIGTNAFNYCFKLIEVCNLSTHITNMAALSTEWLGYVGKYAKNLYNASGSSKLATQGDYIFCADSTGSEYYLVAYTGTEKEITLPNDFNGHDYEINGHAFEYLDLTSITLSDGVTAIGDSAFKDCDALTSLTITSSVSKISGSVFYGCNLFTLQYTGTVADWNAIVKDTYWNNNAPRFTVECTDGNA